MTESMLIGNTFPLTLMRRRLTVDVVPLEELRRAAAGRRIVSFWGHANTLRAASAAVGFDLSPAEERPVLTLSPEAFPSLGGDRPSVGDELKPEEICSWQCLHLVWQ